MLNQFMQDNLAIILIAMTILLVLLIILSIVTLVKLSSTKKRYKMLVNGATGEDLENIIADNIAQMNELVVKNNKIDEDYAAMRNLFEKSLQKIAVYRFSAFHDMGGDMSYAVAMLDHNNNGVIFSSIFGRQESCTYVKPVENGISKYPLSEEENKVLQEAMAK
ncbi:DUF4446 family protein [Megamonas hypermegale]|jgi:hypothetical protein|uniref:DUF4446 domain-containing protein n=1 Tax=Megamonas hypermegale TaxID=158847 RepID=A0A239U340_9FIRM|nr:DUF4446 family protein [Megamonas hypermegale]MBM6761615.1 DUF4446 family protein [Megamonas hypermegale]MBM6832623.1 DUF4446 family protein [Megamonas hypermegale]SNV04282.1 Uncharacterised protein [Megamonas hypermegale]